MWVCGCVCREGGREGGRECGCVGREEGGSVGVWVGREEVWVCG